MKTKVKRSKAKRKRTNRGRRPGPTETDQMVALGYALPADLANQLGVSGSTIYRWADAGMLKPVDGNENVPVYKSPSGNVWILIASARALRPDPAAAVKAS